MKIELMTRMLVAVLCLLCSGCFAPLVEGARQGADVVQRDRLQAKAVSGDPQAQYNLGDTYCCEAGPQFERSISVYDNQKATLWLCKAALQNYGPAQYKLALIYSGKQSGGGMIARVSSWLDDKQTSIPVAWMWASLAATNGVEKAAALRDTLGEKLTAPQRSTGWDNLANWRTQPCAWNDAMKLSTASR